MLRTCGKKVKYWVLLMQGHRSQNSTIIRVKYIPEHVSGTFVSFRGFFVLIFGSDVFLSQ